jgi:hypothetical protein
VGLLQDTTELLVDPKKEACVRIGASYIIEENGLVKAKGVSGNGGYTAAGGNWRFFFSV